MKYMTKFLLFITLLILPLISMAGAGITLDVVNTTGQAFEIFHEGGSRCWYHADFAKYLTVHVNKVSLYSEMDNSGSCNNMINDIWYMRFVVKNAVTGKTYPFALLFDKSKGKFTVQGTKNEEVLVVAKNGWWPIDGTMSIFFLMTGNPGSPQFAFIHASG